MNIVGRITTLTADGFSSNQCLTMLASPSTTEYFYLQLQTCGSDATPPASQSFALQEPSSGPAVFFVSFFSLSLSPSLSLSFWMQALDIRMKHLSDWMIF